MCQNNGAMLGDLEVVFGELTALTCERPSDAHIDVYSVLTRHTHIIDILT